LGTFVANTGSGDFFGFIGLFGQLLVAHNYASGAALSDSITFNNKTFASLGLTPGTYVWTWGTGLENQNFTLVIGGSVPDGGTTVMLLGMAFGALCMARRFLKS
jgi:hypothetical protein